MYTIVKMCAVQHRNAIAAYSIAVFAYKQQDDLDKILSFKKGKLCWEEDTRTQMLHI